jgi:hypothetical protein
LSVRAEASGASIAACFARDIDPARASRSLAATMSKIF